MALALISSLQAASRVRIEAHGVAAEKQSASASAGVQSGYARTGNGEQ